MSIFKRFRNVQTTDRNAIAEGANSGAYVMSPRFDQPTYLSFKLIFGEGGDSFYNNAASQNYVLNYDRMPHPLFAPKGKDDVFEREKYSAIDYLLDANEFTRAQMLEEFITLFNKLQYNYQWYFQKIDGINDLLKIDPLKGMRVTSDKRLSITALEAIDLRFTHLMNLYRKIAWDDTYQRWVLPDMMRYFTLNIYIAEFRTFHTPTPFTGYGYASNNRESSNQLKLNILDDIIPVWQLTCEMCEFDIQSVEYDHLSSLGVDDMPGEAGVKFGIKVGKVYETQIYPTFKNAYLVDRYLNGLDRSKSEDVLGDPELGFSEDFDSTNSGQNNNSTIHNNKLKLGIAQDHTYNTTDREHTSTAPYNQSTNEKSLFGIPAGGPGRDGRFFTNDDEGRVDPADRNTWFNNAKQFGEAFLRNKVEEIVDKSKVTPIPSLGISFNEVEAALEGRNIISSLGLIRKGVETVASQYVQPSELLEGNIVDGIFRAYLEGIAKSEATNEPETKLISAANIALNDDATWSQIKDYSRATDLVGDGEENSPNRIQGGTYYRDEVDDSTQGDLSRATDLVGEGENNSPNKIQGSAINLSEITSEATQNGNLSNNNLTTAESTIEGKINDGYDQGNSNESTATSRSVSSQKLTGEESNINKKINVGTIFEGVPSSQATTNKLQNG